MKDAIAALFSSRKFLIVVCALLACTVLVIFNKLPVEHFVTTLTALAGTLTVAIAIEDHGTKSAMIAAAATASIFPPPMGPAPSPGGELVSSTTESVMVRKETLDFPKVYP